MPTDIQEQITRHDELYIAICYSLFDAASSTKPKDPETALDYGTWQYLHTNSTLKERKLCLQILLDPRMRDFQLRAVLGRRNWRRPDLLATITTLPVNCKAPSIMAIYFLAGTLCDLPLRLTGPPVYVGQAASFHRSTRYGACIGRRIAHNRAAIQHLKNREELPDAHKVRAYGAFSHEHVVGISTHVLLAFPFCLDNPVLHSHLRQLLTIAESIDIIFLDTLSPLVEIVSADKFSNASAVFRLARNVRPHSAPTPFWQGGNYAMPYNQNCYRNPIVKIVDLGIITSALARVRSRQNDSVL